jgi:hypothetical protein
MTTFLQGYACECSLALVFQAQSLSCTFTQIHTPWCALFADGFMLRRVFSQTLMAFILNCYKSQSIVCPKSPFGSTTQSFGRNLRDQSFRILLQVCTWIRLWRFKFGGYFFRIFTLSSHSCQIFCPIFLSMMIAFFDLVIVFSFFMLAFCLRRPLQLRNCTIWLPGSCYGSEIPFGKDPLLWGDW